MEVIEGAGFGVKVERMYKSDNRIENGNWPGEEVGTMGGRENVIAMSRRNAYKKGVELK